MNNLNSQEQLDAALGVDFFGIETHLAAAVVWITPAQE